eukprot:8153698-Pyramimonas_sp.AAC.1
MCIRDRAAGKGATLRYHISPPPPLTLVLVLVLHATCTTVCTTAAAATISPTSGATNAGKACRHYYCAAPLAGIPPTGKRGRCNKK